MLDEIVPCHGRIFGRHWVKSWNAIVAREAVRPFRDGIAASLDQDHVHSRFREARGDGAAPCPRSDDDIVAVEPVLHQKVLR